MVTLSPLRLQFLPFLYPLRESGRTILRLLLVVVQSESLPHLFQFGKICDVVQHSALACKSIAFLLLQPDFPFLLGLRQSNEIFLLVLTLLPLGCTLLVHLQHINIVLLVHLVSQILHSDSLQFTSLSILLFSFLFYLWGELALYFGRSVDALLHDVVVHQQVRSGFQEKRIIALCGRLILVISQFNQFVELIIHLGLNRFQLSEKDFIEEEIRADRVILKLLRPKKGQIVQQQIPEDLSVDDNFAIEERKSRLHVDSLQDLEDAIKILRYQVLRSHKSFGVKANRIFSQHLY